MVLRACQRLEHQHLLVKEPQNIKPTVIQGIRELEKGLTVGICWELLYSLENYELGDGALRRKSVQSGLEKKRSEY